MLAATPGLLAPCAAKNPISSQHCRSASLVRMTCAHLRPGKFQPFEAEVAVRVCAAAVSVHDGGELGHLVFGEDPPERVVGVTEDDQVAAGPEGVLNRVQVQGEQ